MTSPCGCGNDNSLDECFCAVADSHDITWTGSGTATSPLVATLAEGVRVSLSERDTDTVDMHVNETTPGSYEIAADVPPSADPGNALTLGSDGRLFVQTGDAVLPPITWKTAQAQPQTVARNQYVPLVFGAPFDPNSPTGSIFYAPRSGWYDFHGFVQLDNPSTAISALVLFVGDPTTPDNRYTGTSNAQYSIAVGGPGTHCSDRLYLDQGKPFSVWTGQWSSSDQVTQPGRTMFALGWLHE